MAAANPFVHAVHVAALAFADRRRSDSQELYLTHSLDVAQALGPNATTPELTTAVLHDVLEETDWTRDALAESGVDGIVLDAVGVLTRGPTESEHEFISRICTSSGDVGAIARRVKLADLTVNLEGAGSDEERAQYERALPVVRSAIERDPGRE